MKKLLACLLSTILAFSMIGCGLVPSLDLTEDEEKVIAEYAAGLLLKHDRHYKGGLTEISEEEEVDDGLGFVVNQETLIPELEDETSEEGPNPEFDENLTANEMSDVNQVEYSDLSISQAIGLDNFDIVYKSYEVHDIYPEEESTDMVFSMQAPSGMELIVLKFAVTNNSADRALCDVLNKSVSFRLLINESERVNADKTILLNDLGSFSEEVEGYGMTEGVLVFEVAQGSSQTISSLDLVVKNGDMSTTHKLN